MNYVLTAGESTFQVGTKTPQYDASKKAWVTEVGMFADMTGFNYSVNGTNTSLSPVQPQLAGSVVTSEHFLKFWTAQELAGISGLALSSGMVDNFFVGVVAAGKPVDMTDSNIQKVIRLTLTMLSTDIVPVSQRVVRFKQILSAQVA